jgi:hypothetical protein
MSQAMARHIDVNVLHLAGVARDIDEPADLAQLSAAAGARYGFLAPYLAAAGQGIGSSRSRGGAMTTTATRSALSAAADGQRFRAPRRWRSSRATISAGSPPSRRSFALPATAPT